MLRSLLLVGISVFQLATATSLLADAPPAPEPGAPAKAERALHQRLEELDRELRRELERVASGRAPLGALRRDAGLRSYRARLEALRLELRNLDEQSARLLGRKLRALEGLVANLARTGLDTHHSYALPRLSGRQVARVAPDELQTAAPTNDDCDNATVIGLGGVTTGDTSNATRDGVATCGSSLFSPDVWFKYDAPVYGYVSIDTFGADFDTVVSVHTGCPGAPDNEVRCNDDAFGVQSATQFYATAGQEYWIRVSGFNGAVGLFDLHVGTGGGVAGTVTDSTTGDALADGEVEIYNEYGYWEGAAWTDAAGEYSAAGFGAGTYYLRTDDFDGYLDELYDDVACAPSCSITEGTAVGIPSSGDVTGLDFALDQGGAITGTVTHTATGDPISGARVDIYDSGGSFVASDLTDAAGVYEVEGLASGDYFATVESSGYGNELYDDLPCAGGCDPKAGAAIQVVAPQTTPGVDFALDRLGVVTGVVTEAATGDPISGARVKIYSPSGFSYYGSGYSDSSGVYSVGGLPDGSYVAVTDFFGAYVNQVYDGVDCPGRYSGNCDLTAGTPFAATANTIVSGIDFSLDKLGVITGTVTDAVTGEALSNLDVEIWDSDGNFVDWGYVYSAGTYTVPDLAAGTYYAKTQLYYSNSDYRDELYQELPCPDGSCNATSGTAISVSLNATTSGIDFTLDPGGAISGEVTEAATGEPIAYASISIWDASGDLVRSGAADYSGEYSLGGLDAGTYFVTARHSDYRGELYDDLACPGGPPAGCDPTTGSPVAVTFNATTSGVDLALDRLGSISGRITDADTGASIYENVIKLWDASGAFVDDAYYSSTYSFTGLPEGTYYVTASNRDYLDEVYDNLPCADCDPTTGTPITVGLSTSVTDVDFALDRLGTISGIVTDAGTGEPVRYADVSVWNMAGAQIATRSANYSGNYSISLPDGTYFVTATEYGYLAELYDGHACSGCDPTTGTPVAVSLGTDASGVDFSLSRLGSIAGTVATAVAGRAVYDVYIAVWDSAGSYVGSAYSDFAGNFAIGGLPPGTYFATAEGPYASVAFAGQLFSGLPCPGGPPAGCDPTTGTPIAVSLDTATSVAFLVDDPGSISGVVADEEGNSLSGVRLDAWRADGTSAGSSTTDGGGSYDIDDLPPGDYYVTTENSLGYLDEIYDELPCLGGGSSCDPTKGTAVEVTANGTTQVNFVLQLYGAISGTVTDAATGEPLAGILVQAWSSQGGLVDTGLSGASGNYLLSVGPGTFHVSTANAFGFIDEVYDGIDCAGVCDPSAGASISVALSGDDTVATGIDFALVDARIFADGFESGDVAAWN